jgi:cysteine-rich repeat protein
VCDDKNNINETSCPYGVKNCTTCNATCTAPLGLTGPHCGDTRVTDGELCDDGNATTESACPYGTASCTRCDETCKAELSLMGPYCGDRVTNGTEVCDDGNAEACGTCSTTCSTPQYTKATGTIVTTNTGNIRDGETFTLNDGLNTPLVFELDEDGATNPSFVTVNLVGLSSSAQVAQAIVTAITGKAAALSIGAAISPSSTSTVNLTHKLEGLFGNQLISESVRDSNFRVSGMSGGSGRDCSTGTRCARTEDCAPDLVCLPDFTCGPAPTP